VLSASGKTTMKENKMKKQDMRPLMKPYEKTKGGDKICTEDAYIYVHPGVKVGSAIGDLDRRLEQQGLTRDDVTYWIILRNCHTHDDIWTLENRLARRLGLPVEYGNQRLLVGDARSRSRRSYIVTNTETGDTFRVEHAGRVERRHNLSPGSFSRAASSKSTAKFVVLDGIKHTAAHAEVKQ
jgi:hypothetical protein